MAETSLERLKQRLDQVQAQYLAAKRREAEKERKRDTRRKVILGGALMELAERDDAAVAMLERLVRNLAREQDRKVFEGWTAPKAGSGAPAPPAVGQGGTESGESDAARDEAKRAADRRAYLERLRVEPGAGGRPNPYVGS